MSSSLASPDDLFGNCQSYRKELSPNFPSKKYLTVGDELEVSMSEVGEMAGGGVRW